MNENLINTQDYLIQAKGLTKSFGKQRVLNGIDFTVSSGEVILLRGENGSGKTTLLNILTGNLIPDAGQIVYRTSRCKYQYNFPKSIFSRLNRYVRFSPELIARAGVGRCWQDVRLFRTQSLRDNIAVADARAKDPSPFEVITRPRLTALIDKQIFTEADNMLASLGLADRRKSSADMISLGQSKRVAIARAVTAGANLLLLDEPLAGLDKQGIKAVISLLQDLVAKSSISLIIVEHVFSQIHLHELVTTDWFLAEGSLIKTTDFTKSGNNTNAIINHPAQDQMAKEVGWSGLDSASNATELSQSLPSGASLSTVWTQAAADSNPTSDIILTCDQIVVRRGGRIAVGLDDNGQATGLSFKIRKGECILLQAPNGWGKTTLFDAICGNIPLAGGTISYAGNEMGEMPPWKRWKLGLSTSSAAANLFGALDIEEVRQLARLPVHTLSHLHHLKGKKIYDMSGGERQLVSVSIAIEMARLRPGLLILDEPLAMLDATANQMVQTRLRTLSSAVFILNPATH